MSGGRPYERFGRFNLVGALGAVFQIVLLELLSKCFEMPAVAATPIAVEIVVLHNFFWHERFTWRDRMPGGTWLRANRLWRFHVGNGLISVIGNTALTYCLVEQLNWLALPATAAAIAICAPLNFLMADRWVYAAEKTAGKSPCPVCTPSGGPAAARRPDPKMLAAGL